MEFLFLVAFKTPMVSWSSALTSKRSGSVIASRSGSDALTLLAALDLSPCLCITVLVVAEEAFQQDKLSELLSRSKSKRILQVSASLAASHHVSLPSDIEVLTICPPYGPSTIKSINEHLQANTRPRLPHSKSSGIVPRQAQSDIARTEEIVATTETLSVIASSLPATEEGMDEFRALIIEDNPINLKLLTTLCSRMGIPTETAVDGAEAVVKFIAFKPSLVLLDISLPIQVRTIDVSFDPSLELTFASSNLFPNQDGFAACAQMRTHVFDHHPQIIAVTALSSPADKARGVTSGIDGWRTKPVSMRELRSDLETWRKNWYERQEMVQQPAQ